MGNKKLVLASDVGGMKELIENEKTGYLFKADDKEDLKKYLLKINEDGISDKFIEDAYNYVKNEKSWLANGEKYKDIYLDLKGLK